MSKKYKGKVCAYCDGVAVSADHVFAREFFLPEDRADLPKVPACGTCNNEKSQLEHYLSAILPFGGRHLSAARNLSEMVPKRLAKNPKLHSSLRESWGRMWARESNIHLPVSTLSVDPVAIQRLFHYIVRGLVRFHWGTQLNRNHGVAIVVLTSHGEQYFDRLLSLNASRRVKGNLGSGTVTYEGAQAVDVPEITVWRIEAYGGMKFSDPSQPGEVASRVGGLTGPSPEK